MIIEKCALYNDADDNSLSVLVPTTEKVLSNLVLSNFKHDCEIWLRWFRQNVVDANPRKFQFLVSSPYIAENRKFIIDENTTIAPETFVKYLHDVYICCVLHPFLICQLADHATGPWTKSKSE